MSPFVRYSLIKLENNTQIELIHGDMTKLNVNAYINPANANLKHMGGLAKALSRAGGKQVEQECNKFMAGRQNVPLKEGDVFVSGAGDRFLGCLSNSIIVHAVGPIWRNGINQEESNLTNAVWRSLENMDSHFKSSTASNLSVAIPPISTGIFNYPITLATKVITETVIKYVQERKKDSKIKDIKFISNEENTINEWTKVLAEISVKKSLQVNATSMTNARWYWMDDQGLWKMFMTKYVNFIQSNFEQKNFRFAMDIIESGNSYEIDLTNMTQTNKKTKFVHKISNTVPTTQRFQWCWVDDSRNHSPYSVTHSDLIESAYASNKVDVELKIKRHDNDQEDTYRITFGHKNAQAQAAIQMKDPNAVAIQLNLVTKYERLVHRNSLREYAQVANEESASSSPKPTTHIYISSLKNQAKNVESKLKAIIQEGYVNERVSFIDISSEKLEELKLHYDASITNDSEHLIITAIKEQAVQLKSALLEMAVEGSKFAYPKDWSPMEANCSFKIDEINKDSAEFKQIEEHFKQTLPKSTISKIERIQNKWLWKLYAKSVSILKEKSSNENERFLFHGTRTNE
jgi:O-acetyl-ADP-ribose deacetylase (regulator of RNase III)